jgi:hypothetical protein
MLQSKKDFVHGLHGFSLIKKYIKIISLRLCAAPAGGQEKNLCDLCVK